MADDAGLRRATRLVQLGEQDIDERIIGPGKRHAVIVEDALPRQLADSLGEPFVSMALARSASVRVNSAD